MGAEGTWEDVTEEQIADLKKAVTVSKKIEQKVLASRQSSEWDKALDKGRVKKTMKDKIEKALLTASSMNAFQFVQNERGDTKEYSHSSYQSKKENNRDNGDNSSYDDDLHSGDRTGSGGGDYRDGGRGRDGGKGGGRGRDGGRGGGRGRDGGRGGGRGRGRDGGRGGGRGRGRDGGRGGGRGRDGGRGRGDTFSGRGGFRGGRGEGRDRG